MLSVFLFGQLRLQRDGDHRALALPHMVAALLAYLLLDSRAHSRHELVGALWHELPDDRARRCLNTTLWRLRQSLGRGIGTSEEDYIVTEPNGNVRFDPGPGCWIDVLTFEHRVTELLARSPETLGDVEIHAWHAALDLYRGELLPGFPHEWVDAERERLRHRHIEALVGLMRAHYRRRDREEALELGRRILRADVLREDIHQMMMEIYLDSGHRAMAMRQYESCRAALNDELHTAPMPRTQALYHRILDNGGPAGPVPLHAAPPSRSAVPSRSSTDPAQLVHLRADPAAQAVCQSLLRELEQATAALLETGERIRNELSALRASWIRPVLPGANGRAPAVSRVEPPTDGSWAGEAPEISP